MTAPNDMLTRDPTREIPWHRPDDRFVPLRDGDLLGVLADEASRFGMTSDQLRAFAAALQDVVLQETVAFARQIDSLYAPFNPDRDTKPLADPATERSPAAYERMRAWLRYLLTKANFTRLTDVQLVEAIRRASIRGMRVRLRPERIDTLRLWVRGRGVITTRQRVWSDAGNWRHWRRLVRGRDVEVPVYRRLAVVARLKNDPYVLLKLFKDIPEADIEALLPHAEVTMNLIDRVLVFGSSAGALGSAAAKVVAFLTGSVVALSQLLWVVLVGTGMMVFRTLMGYRRTRIKRDSQRTQNLYFQNIANNAAAIQALVAIINQEELKEALLAYVHCHATDGAPQTAPLAARVERFLSERFDAELTFDWHDALATLERLGLLEPGSDPPRVVPVERATAQLKERWIARTNELQHCHAAEAFLEPG